MEIMVHSKKSLIQQKF